MKPVKASRQGPLVSYIFFADDLVLFGEALIPQANLIAEILEYFCLISSQKVSTQKCKLYASKNVPMELKVKLRKKFNTPLTSNLSLYLEDFPRKSWIF